ncbi:MAG TPA: hypothetical protein VF528_20825 [Pyrinomonadaceae bacterium]
MFSHAAAMCEPAAGVEVRVVAICWRAAAMCQRAAAIFSRAVTMFCCAASIG